MLVATINDNMTSGEQLVDSKRVHHSAQERAAGPIDQERGRGRLRDIRCRHGDDEFSGRRARD